MYRVSKGFLGIQYENLSLSLSLSLSLDLDLDLDW